jgi:hypothetical protein
MEWPNLQSVFSLTFWKIKLIQILYEISVPLRILQTTHPLKKTQ